MRLKNRLNPLQRLARKRRMEEYRAEAERAPYFAIVMDRAGNEIGYGGADTAEELAEHACWMSSQPGVDVVITAKRVDGALLVQSARRYADGVEDPEWRMQCPQCPCGTCGAEPEKTDN